MTAAPPPRLAERPAAADRATSVTGTLLSLYLVLMLWPMTLWARSTGSVIPLVLHVASIVVSIALTRSRRGSLRPARDWLLLLLGPFLYIELRWLIEGAGLPHRDSLVLGWERAIFPSLPASTWAPAVPSLVLSESLHFAYASYYLLVYVPPLILYLCGRREEFARTLLALGIVYGLCFLTYVLFPVDGPRFIRGPAAAPDGPVRTFVLHLLATASSRGTAFPSSHVAASTVASLCALRFQPRVGYVVSVLTAGLAAATVYGGFHYAIDAVAGLVGGVMCWICVEAWWRRVSPTASSASVPT